MVDMVDIRLEASPLVPATQCPRQAPKHTVAHRARQLATRMEMRLHLTTPLDLFLLTPNLRHPAIHHTRRPDTPPNHTLPEPATIHISLLAL